MLNVMMATRTSSVDTRAAARLQLAVMRLARRLRQQAPEGITPSQLSALSTLFVRGALTLGELAEAERVRPPTMTRIVGGLEESGLVERTRDEKDRRCARVVLTKLGRTFVERSRTKKTAYLVGRLKDLSEEDVTALERATEILEKVVEEEAKG
jgi:DNA-binding MarR family transcriptional regulator